MVYVMKLVPVELKAKMKDIKEVKRRLSLLGAQHIGSFHQIDTYFKVHQGRLKIRETERRDGSDIIFYERPDVPNIKKSHVLLIQAQPTEIAKELLSKLFPTSIVVDKIREIYIFGEIRVHLDQVTQLGAFIELELPTTGRTEEIRKSESLLTDLSVKLGIKKEDLEALSYADLLFRKAPS